MDADGLSRNPNPLQDDMTGARWHGISDQEAVPGWHASSYLAWMEGKSSQVMTETLREVVDEDSDEGGPRVAMDVWKDNGLLYRLQQGEFPPNITYQERDRITHRMARFRWKDDLIFRIWLDGTRRVVPRPTQRFQLIQQVHEDLGHFGVRRTHAMLRGQYWWIGMHQEVTTYVGRCGVCDRVRSSFNTLSPQLRPLPIMGLGYRWSLDFARPLLTTSRGAKYVLVMVEHFSKWIELVALP